MDETKRSASSRACLFMPCLADQVMPEIGQATARLLWSLGLEVEYPEEQTCCGQPAFNAGHWEAAIGVARHWLGVFSGGDDIVCPSGSCVAMVRNHYPRLFANSPAELERAARAAERTFELTEFLVDRLGVTDTGAGLDARVTYHDSCHLARGLGIREEPRALLRAVRGLELIEMVEPDRCCGFGGTFSVKLPEVSAAMVRRKLDRIEETGADAVVACDPGCLLHIRRYINRVRSPVRALHIAQVLAPPSR